MTELRAAAMTSKAWPFEVARALVKRVEKTPPEKGYVLFETGYGPSGLPHIGTFGEVARTTMVRRAFEALSDIPTRLICFSDDMDGMRKVPENVPQPRRAGRASAKAALGCTRPLRDARELRRPQQCAPDRLPRPVSASSTSSSPPPSSTAPASSTRSLLRAAEKYDAIMAVMLKTLGEERQQTYSPFLPISPTTGRVLYVPMKNVDAAMGEITFDDEDGTETTLPVTGGHVKLQWKPDFGARWAALGVDFEMFGKDHSSNAPVYDRICEILGVKAPEHYVYELFLDGEGQKISKSKGNGLTIEEWLTYASTESLGLYMFQKPRTAKRLHWDVIPRAVDEYHQHLRAFADQDLDKRLANPAWHIHRGQPPASDLAVPFAMLLNLASAASAEDKEVLWGFIRKYAPEASPETHPSLDAAAGHAVAYFNDHVKPTKTFRAPTEKERAALADLRTRLAAWEGGTDAEELQNLVFAVGNAHAFDPLRDWFKAIYEVLLGASQGPPLRRGSSRFTGSRRPSP